jgi:hypothetical protein
MSLGNSRLSIHVKGPFSRVRAGGLRIRLDVDDFTDKSLEDFMVYPKGILLKDLAASIRHVGEKKPPYTIKLDVRKTAETGNDRIKKLISLALSKKTGDCFYDYRIVELPIPQSPRNLFDIYPEMEKQKSIPVLTIDQVRCSKLGVSIAQVRMEIDNLIFLYPELNAEQFLVFPIHFRDMNQGGKQVSVPLKELVKVE